MNRWKQSVDTNDTLLAKDARSLAVAVFKLKTGDTYTNYIVQLFSKQFIMYNRKKNQLFLADFSFFSLN